MNEWLKRIREQLTALWARWNRTQKIILFSIIGASITGGHPAVRAERDTGMRAADLQPDHGRRRAPADRREAGRDAGEVPAAGRQRVLRCRRAGGPPRAHGAQPGEPHPQGHRSLGPVRHAELDHHGFRARREPPARRHPAARAAHPGAGRRGQRERRPADPAHRAVRRRPEAGERLHQHHPEAGFRLHDQPEEDRGRAAPHQARRGRAEGREYRHHGQYRGAAQRFHRAHGRRPAGAGQARAEGEAGPGGEVHLRHPHCPQRHLQP